MTDSLDLNLDNYELADLLELFKLDYDFGHDDLKQAKRMVLQTHPDKSKLPKEYFLFFSSAFKVIYSIYEFRNRGDKERSTVYTVEKDEEKEALLKQIANKPNFNKIFNELFEKHRIKSESSASGYGDWLKSDEDIDTRTTTKAEMNAAFDAKKTEVRALVVHREVEEANAAANGSAYDIVGAAPDNYGSSIFSSLQYEDLKKAHVESVVPVTQQDLESRPSFKNEQELRAHRERDATQPLSLQQSKKYLAERKGAQDKSDVRRAFELAKQDEAARKANQEWMSNFKRLTNS